MSHFSLDLILTGNYRDWLLSGLLVSLELTGVTLVLAVPVAIAVALLRLSPLAPVRLAGAAFIEGIRNVPLLVHLLFWYFGAPELLPVATKEWLYRHNIEFISAVVALTLYTAAYMAEDIRSGMRAISTVQREAGRALGFGFIATMRRVVLPQAMRLAAPPLISQTLTLWRDTSIATVIGVAEMMYQAARIESATFRSTEAFVLVTAAYLTVALGISGLATWFQHRHPVRNV